MQPLTICFTYFRSLTLAHLEAALYSVRRQDLSRVEEIIVVDNNTDDPAEHIEAVIEQLAFPVPVRFSSLKHGNLAWTHAWATNVTVRGAWTPWVLYTRADYLLEFTLINHCLAVVDEHPATWDGFVVGHGCHLQVPLVTCENSSWRQDGPNALRAVGSVYDYTCIDSGVWMGRRDTFDRVGGLHEGLTAWGHAQTHFQWKLHKDHVECVRIPEVLFFHPQHGGEKDLNLAHRQVAEHGLNLQEMWARYDGPRMY